MNDKLPTTTTPGTPLQFADLDSKARTFSDESRSAHTRRAHRSDFRHFTDWCVSIGLPALPASISTIVRYQTDLAGSMKVATLARRISSIAVAHQLAHQPPPTEGAEFRAFWSGLRRAKGVAQVGPRACWRSEVLERGHRSWPPPSSWIVSSWPCASVGQLGALGGLGSGTFGLQLRSRRG